MSDEGVKPDPDRISSLSDYPVPTDQTGVRSFLGLCNQLAFFVPDYQHHTVALRQLTGKGRPFLWLPEHQHKFATSHPSMPVISRTVDDDYRALIQDVLHGTSTSSYARSLKSDRASLSVSDGLVLLDSCRIVLPASAVRPVLQLLHASHSGINKTIVLARGLYYWPGMVNDIKQLVSSCRDCSKLLQSQPGNPMTTAPPSSHF